MLVLIIPDHFRVLFGLCTNNSWWSGLDKACTYHSRPLRVLFGLAPVIPSGPVLIRLEHIIPDLFRIMLGHAPIIPSGPVMLGLVLIIPDLSLVLLGICT